MPIYEYLLVVCAATTNWSDIAHLPASERPAQTWTPKQWIWRPGAKEAEERSEPNYMTILNELGREGYQIVGFTHPNSRIVYYDGKGNNNVYGVFGEIGSNMDTRYIMMREIKS
jgi:hypothetical protein